MSARGGARSWRLRASGVASAAICLGVCLAVSASAGAAARSASARLDPSQRVVGHDRAVVSRIMMDCRAFALHGCPFGATAWTANGRGGLLYAIDVRKTAGDSCGLGVVYFFDVERLIATTGRLAPHAAVAYLFRAVTAAGPRRFAVRYAVNPSGNAFCYQFGSAGTDSYVYGWNGHHLILISGRPPRPPRALAP